MITEEFIEKYEIYFTIMDNIYRKTRDYEVLITDKSKHILSHKEIILVHKFYNYFKEDINKIEYSFLREINKLNERRSPFVKTLNAWKNHIYVKDNSCLMTLYNKFHKNKEFEERLIESYENMNLDVFSPYLKKRNNFNIFEYSPQPKLIVNGNYVQVIKGSNCFLKKEKIVNTLRKVGYILYNNDKSHKFYLFSTKEIRDLVIKDKNKYKRSNLGIFFNENDYEFINFRRANQKLLTEYNKPMLKLKLN